jgi:hypothetical protein
VTDAERLRIVLAHVRKAQKITAGFADRKAGAKPERARETIKELKRVLDSRELLRAMSVVPISKSTAQADGKSRIAAKNEQAA